MEVLGNRFGVNAPQGEDKLNADDIARGTATEPTGCNGRDALVNQIKVQS